MDIKESENSIRFVIGEETVIEITPDAFLVNGEDESFDHECEDLIPLQLIETEDLYSAFKAYQERCAERKALNEPMTKREKETLKNLKQLNYSLDKLNS